MPRADKPPTSPTVTGGKKHWPAALIQFIERRLAEGRARSLGSHAARGLHPVGFWLQVLSVLLVFGLWLKL